MSWSTFYGWDKVFRLFGAFLGTLLSVVGDAGGDLRAVCWWFLSMECWEKLRDRVKDAFKKMVKFILNVSEQVIDWKIGFIFGNSIGSKIWFEWFNGYYK